MPSQLDIARDKTYRDGALARTRAEHLAAASAHLATLDPQSVYVRTPDAILLAQVHATMALAAAE